MTNLSGNLAMSASEIADVTSQFFENCGGNPGFQLSCLNVETKEVEFIPLEKPCVLMGRAKDCDVKLKQRDISYRHVYLQLINQRLLVVDLGSRVGTHWDGSRRRSGWLLPGREIEVGVFKIRLVKWNNSVEKTASQSDSDVDIKSVLESDSIPFPQSSLELLSARSQSRTGRILVLKPGVTLIGRSRVAQLRLKHQSVSHVHSSLVLTREGLWVVDLMELCSMESLSNLPVCKLMTICRLEHFICASIPIWSNHRWVSSIRNYGRRCCRLTTPFCSLVIPLCIPVIPRSFRSKMRRKSVVGRMSRPGNKAVPTIRKRPLWKRGKTPLAGPKLSMRSSRAVSGVESVVSSRHDVFLGKYLL